LRGKLRQGHEGKSAGWGAGAQTGLIARCRRGEESAWAELYRTHQHRVIRFLRSFLGPVREVDDLVQQVFLEMVRSLPQFRGESSLNTWMFSVVRHVAEIHLRAEFRRDRRRQAYAEWSDMVGLKASNPAVQAERTEILRVVAEALESMDVRHRMAWMMVEVEGMNSQEASAALKIPPGTIRSRMHHARAEILEALSEAGLHRGRGKEDGKEDGKDLGCPVTKVDFRNGSRGGKSGPDKG